MTSFWDYVMKIPVETKIILILLVVTGVYKGVVKIPYINWPKEKKPKAHKDCPLYFEYLEMRNNALEISLTPIQLVRSQMAFVDDLEETTRNILYKHFLKLLCTKNGEDFNAVKHPDAQDYLLAVNYSLCRVKQRIKSFLVENHIADMTELEFLEKSTNRTNQVIDLFTTEMNENHPANLSIPRNEVYNHNQCLMEQIRGLVVEMWVVARTLALESKQKLKDLAERECLMVEGKGEKNDTAR